ncbi:MAG: ABC transporter permease, partial [Acidobacteriaceae bacterium]|nr:ABC transporter permease [Acidobacteriaceae bacterium]
MTSSASALRAYVTETKYETVRMLRSPSFSGVFLTIPVLVYMLFGVVLFGTQLRSDPKAAIAVFSGFSVFGIMGPALFGFGVTIAIEREQGLLRLKQALPMPAGAHIAAKLVMSMLFAAVIMGTMEVAGLTLAHLSLSTGQLLAMALLNIVGVLPFCAL